MVAGHVNGPVIPTVGVHCTSRYIRESPLGFQAVRVDKSQTSGLGIPSGPGGVSEVVCLSSDFTVDRLCHSIV